MVKKILSVLVAAIMMCAPLCACTPQNDGEEIDPNRTQLYIGIYEGGWGREWIDEMKKGFEAIYPEVQLMIEGKKEEFTNDNLKASIESGQFDMYFSTASPSDFVANESVNNKLMDITEAVTTPLTEYGETRSIEDKMDPFMQSYMKASNSSGKYYTIPMYTSFYNIVYDVDLFENDRKPLYFAEDGTFTSGKTDSGAKAKSVGQDGVAGTYDDGLPVTWDDFKRLLSKMVEYNICPFVWGSDVSAYRADYFTTVWANYEGEENFKLNFTFDGIDTSQAGTDTDESGRTGLRITEQNGYELQKQPGKRYALEMAKYIINNNLYHGESFYGSFDYLAAQNAFLYSKYRESEGGQRIAMLIEGGWWENEAKATIEEMTTKYGDEYANRRFGIMTVPRFEGGSTQKTLYSVTGNSVVLIRKNAKQPDWAIKFLRYTTTDENLRLYTRMTGSTRAYDYDLTKEDLEQMSYYKCSLWDIFSNENTGPVYAYGPSKLALNNQSYFRSTWNWNAVTSAGRQLNEPLTVFEQYGDQVSVDDYLTALYDYHKNNWNSLNR